MKIIEHRDGTKYMVVMVDNKPRPRKLVKHVSGVYRDDKGDLYNPEIFPTECMVVKSSGEINIVGKNEVKGLK